MRFVIYGAGAVGGSMGGCLFQAGHRVELIARGRHLAAIQSGGLVLERRGQRAVLPVAAVAGPGDVDWGEPAVVVLAMKSQDTEAALAALEAVAPPETAVVCAQNGVANERRTLRRFANTYGLCVMCPATYLEPGVVVAHCAPLTGILDLGRYPAGVDGTAGAVAAALEEAGFESRPEPDIMRWKYRKLLLNLANAVDALAGPEGLGGELAQMAVVEGEAVLAAAGVDAASAAEDLDRRGDRLPLANGWSGGSSWQSIARGAGSIETDYLNGEIVLLGRLHGVATPVNRFLQARGAALARDGALLRSTTPERLLDQFRTAQAAGTLPD
ncbi:MAG TPA: 2-dehydropantoate 2-reductase [Acidimicrobiales bacterium]|nr:2-dehydropantoate 2-reductase [Acidimicrobiales bacterium]